MTDTFRALCAELTEALDSELDLFETRHSALLDRARATLAQPEPVAPTDEELWSVGNDDFRANCYPTDAIRFARAVLSRYSHQ